MFNVELVLSDDGPAGGTYVRENWKIVPVPGDEISIADIGRFVVDRRMFVESDHGEPIGEGQNRVLLHLKRSG